MTVEHNSVHCTCAQFTWFLCVLLEILVLSLTKPLSIPSSRWFTLVFCLLYESFIALACLDFFRLQKAIHAILLSGRILIFIQRFVQLTNFSNFILGAYSKHIYPTMGLKCAEQPGCSPITTFIPVYCTSCTVFIIMFLLPCTW